MDRPSDGDFEGIPLRRDLDAESADPPSPAFLDRPEGAPVYHGFPLLEESRTADGWCFGTISDFESADGLDWGDAFVVAPDDSRAGLVWEVGPAELAVLDPPDDDRWGLYHLGFAREVHNRQELIEQLQQWLPELRRLHGEWRAGYRGEAPPAE